MSIVYFNFCGSASILAVTSPSQDRRTTRVLLGALVASNIQLVVAVLAVFGVEGRAADAPASDAALPHFKVAGLFVAGLFEAPVHEVFIGLVWCATSGLCFHMTQPFFLSAISPVTLILDMRSWSVITVRSRTFSNTRVSSASVDGFEKKCSRFKVVSPMWHRHSVGTMPSAKTDDDDMVGEVVGDGGDVLDAPA